MFVRGWVLAGSVRLAFCFGSHAATPRSFARKAFVPFAWADAGTLLCAHCLIAPRASRCTCSVGFFVLVFVGVACSYLSLAVRHEHIDADKHGHRSSTTIAPDREPCTRLAPPDRGCTRPWRCNRRRAGFQWSVAFSRFTSRRTPPLKNAPFFFYCSQYNREQHRGHRGVPSLLQDHGGVLAGRAVVRRGLDSGESRR